MASAQSRPDFTLEVRRTFAAPREKVFAAWTEPAQLEKWMCRDVSAHTVIHHQQDIRTGGRYLMEVRNAAKGEVYWGQGVYLEVNPPEKVRFTWSWTKDRPDGENMQPGIGGDRSDRGIPRPRPRDRASPHPHRLPRTRSSAKNTTAAGTAASTSWKACCGRTDRRRLRTFPGRSGCRCLF